MLPLTFDHLFLPLYLKKGTTAGQFHFFRVPIGLSQEQIEAPGNGPELILLRGAQIVPKHQRIVDKSVIVVVQVPVHRIPSKNNHTPLANSVRQ